MREVNRRRRPRNRRGSRRWRVPTIRGTTQLNGGAWTGVVMSSREAPGDCGKAGSRASRGSAHAGVGASMRGSGCEDAAIVLVWDMRQASLFTGLRDLLRFLVVIGSTNTEWRQGDQQTQRETCKRQRGKSRGKQERQTSGTGTSENTSVEKPTWKPGNTKPPALAPLRASQAAETTST